MPSAIVKVLVIVTVALFVADCARKTVRPTAPPVPPAVAVAPPAPPAPPDAPGASAPSGTASLSEDDIFAQKTLDELNAEVPLSDVLFDLDGSVLRDDARSTLSGHAGWLARWPSTRVTVEGHCDERGTAEYNLSLGERRAAAIQSYLADLGVAADRVLVVSKGKETPICAEQSEDCWQRNRRGHFVITAK